MSEGTSGQFDSSQALKKDRKDLLVNTWAEQLRKTEKMPEQILGDFVSEGAKMINYVPLEEKKWKPTIIPADFTTPGNGRERVLLAGNVGGPIFEAETLKEGLSFSVNIDGPRGFKNTESFCMIPYPNFDQEGKFKIDESQVLLFSENQAQELKTLVGLTSS